MKTMRALLLFGAALGFAGVLAAAHYYPWVVHPRVPAHAEVITNGGRAEAFVIRLPADRIVSEGSAETGLRATPFPAAIELAAGAPWLVEQFRLRDIDGHVIGVAARHWTETEGGPAATWCLVIPGRGALLLSGQGEARGAIDAALERAGFKPGNAWSGTVELRPDGGTGQIVTGSREFAGFAGQYTEAWSLTGVSADGELHGTIELDTRSFVRS